MHIKMVGIDPESRLRSLTNNPIQDSVGIHPPGNSCGLRYSFRHPLDVSVSTT